MTYRLLTIFFLLTFPLVGKATELCPEGRLISISKTLHGEVDTLEFFPVLPTYYWYCAIRILNVTACGYVPSLDYTYCNFNAEYTGAEVFPESGQTGGTGGAGGAVGADGHGGQGGKGGDGGMGGKGGQGGDATVNVTNTTTLQPLVDELQGQTTALTDAIQNQTDQASSDMYDAVDYAINAFNDAIGSVSGSSEGLMTAVSELGDRIVSALNGITGGTGGEPTPSVDCVAHPDDISCTSLEEQPVFDPEAPPAYDPDLAEQATDAFTWTPGTLSTGGSCPASQSMSFAGHTVQIPMEPICDAASSYLRPFTLLLASVSAYYLFVGGLKTS